MNAYEVRCNRCNWEGFRTNLQEFGCPACQSGEFLEYDDKLERAAFNLELAGLEFKRIWTELVLLIKPLR